MDDAKIQLSPEEFELVKNGHWILTKNRIIQKVQGLLGEAGSGMHTALIKYSTVHGLLKSPAKISRGENYQGLPYVVLDYPREFSQDNIFAIRSLFWWGNYFSITLHLKGHYQQLFSPCLLRNQERLAAGSFHISTVPGEWDHEFNETMHLPLDKLSPEVFREMTETRPFTKISAKMHLTQWSNAEKWLVQQFEVLVSALSS